MADRVRSIVRWLQVNDQTATVDDLAIDEAFQAIHIGEDFGNGTV